MASSPYQVLCVCLGNICRSPTAEIVLKHYVKLAGLPIEIDSAGTSNYHPNKAPDPRTQKFARARGYDLSHLRARQICREDYDQFDLILAMDETNLSDLKWQINNLVQQGELDASVIDRVVLMSEQDRNFFRQAIPDPYFGQASDFEQVIVQCESAAQAWVEYWQANPDILRRQP